jgi:hypothetical protein
MFKICYKDAMRIQFCAVLLTLFAVGGYAQTARVLSGADVSQIVVLEKKWKFQVRNPLLDESPFLEMEDRVQYESDVRANRAENRRRAGLGLKPVKMPERPPIERKDGRAEGAYSYEIKVQNASSKPIQALILEYVFYVPNTETEVGRLRFLSRQPISPGKTKTLIFRIASPPAGTVNAGDAQKKTSELYSEQIVVRGIAYKDGSIWGIMPAKQLQ